MHWLKPHQEAALKNMLWCYSGHHAAKRSPDCEQNKLHTELHLEEHGSRVREASSEAAQGDPQFKRGAEKMEKVQQRCLTRIPCVERLKELGLITLVKKKPQRYLTSAYSYLKGSSLDTTIKLLGSVREPNKENNHTKQFQRLKLDSWKKYFS